MTAINTLGVTTLSIKGFDADFHRLTRFFRTRSEAETALTDAQWQPEEDVMNACLTGDEGLLVYNHTTQALDNADAATRAYVDVKISELVGDAPEVLNSLSELADALGDDVSALDNIRNSVVGEEGRATAAEQSLEIRIDSIEDGFDFTGKITAPATDNVIPFLFTDQASFPTADSVHGAILHSHADGAMFYAHGGAWHKLAKDSDIVDASTKADLSGANFTGDVSTTGDLDVAGNIQVDNDGGYFLQLDRNTTTQLDIATGNIPSGGNLNIKNSNGTDARVVVYSDEFWVRGLGGSNGNGTAKFDGNVTLNAGQIFANGLTDAADDAAAAAAGVAVNQLYRNGSVVMIRVA